VTRIAAALGLTGVALGAFGAHALKTRLSPEHLETYRTGVLYHLIHAVALLALGRSSERLRAPAITAALFAGGVVIFSGSLYVLAVTGVRAWGAVTPFGGLALLGGWSTLLFPARIPPSS
jgi:uncharacterized membrane protein YgdD (TMEM256/DUF423 family)